MAGCDCQRDPALSEAAPERGGGRRRVVVGGISPVIDGGRVPLKRVVGDTLVVEADAFADGHDRIEVVVRWRHQDDQSWSWAPMAPLGNDRFQGTVPLDRIGRVRLEVAGAVDPLATWRAQMMVRLQAGAARPVDLAVGAALLEEQAAQMADAEPAGARSLRAAGTAVGELAPSLGVPASAGTIGQALEEIWGDHRVDTLGAGHFDPSRTTTVPAGEVWVDSTLAGASAWYELFPRSASPDPNRPGTLRDVRDRLGYVAGLGFDVLYLPPVHPIGTTNRKGRNGATQAGPDEPGSPWAIGGPAGGHTAVHPDLGTLADLVDLVGAARAAGLEVALDLAFQCSPDHPWVRTHPAWFRHLPDGSIAYAENPPKRYEDVLPLDFESPEWPALWEALAEVVRFWIAQGIRIFRVDNPHTKPMVFWEWLLASIRAEHPEVIFLAEAFTRPRVMEHLAKIGFSQSYTYFTWRTTKGEIEQYLAELTRAPLVEYFRPNFWPNTPDILPPGLQQGGRAAFAARLVLAATAAANYGIYGPAFELQEHQPREPGSEEYRDSEKYQIRHWDLEDPESLAGLVARINAIRRAHPALRQDRTLLLQRIDCEAIVAYAKTLPVGSSQAPSGDVVLCLVNLDPHHVQSGWTDLDLDALGLPADRPYQATDLLTGERYVWQGPRNFVSLDPAALPAHVLHLSAREGEP